MNYGHILVQFWRWCLKNFLFCELWCTEFCFPILCWLWYLNGHWQALMTLMFQNFSSYHTTQQQLHALHSQEKGCSSIPAFHHTKLDKLEEEYPGLETVPDNADKLVNCSHDISFHQTVILFPYVMLIPLCCILTEWKQMFVKFCRRMSFVEVCHRMVENLRIMSGLVFCLQQFILPC